MRRYETIVILDADLSEEGRKPILEKLEELINQFQGALIRFDEWGVRKLAYEIKKKGRGYYLRMDYCGDGPLVDEIERFFRIDERILKFMTILLEENTDLEAVMAEVEREKEAKAAQTEQATDAAADDTPADGGDADAEGDQPETRTPEVEEA